MRIESWVLSYLVNSLWQVPLLFVAGWIAARALRQAGPAAEHRVWVSVLALQSILPACSALPRGWMRSLLYGGASSSGGDHVTVLMGPGVGFSANHVSAWLLAAIAVAYGWILVYFAARFAWHWWTLHAIRTESVEVALPREIALLWEQCLKRFKIGGVTLVASSRISGPVTMGFWRKLVLLPEELIARLPETEVHAVFAHEFAHIRRNDFAKNLIYELLGLPVSYHPLFWPTRRRMRESREIVCDQMAAEAGGRGQYTRSLLRLASLLAGGMPVGTPHALGIFDTKTFERRIMKLSEKGREIRGARRLAIVIACAAFGVAACGSALALGVQVDASAASSASRGTNPSPKNNFPAGVMRVGGGVSAPVLIHYVDPEYTIKARRAKYQGICVLSLIVDKDGSPRNIRVVRKLGMGLDEKAVEAVKQYRFKPAYYKGHPVSVLINVEVNFKIYD